MDPENQTSTSPDISKEGTDYVQHEQPAAEGHKCWYVLSDELIAFMIVSFLFLTVVSRILSLHLIFDITVAFAVILVPPVSL